MAADGSGRHNRRPSSATEGGSSGAASPHAARPPPSTPAADYADAITGDFYYNSSTGQFKTVNSGGAPIGTWASGGSLNDARSELGGVGTQTAALAFGGNTPPETGNTETYDGSSWTEVNNLNQ